MPAAFKKRTICEPLQATCSHEDNETFLGKYFSASDYVASVTKDTPYYWLIEVPAGYTPSIGFNVTSDQTFTLSIYENVQVSNKGTSITIYDNNRTIKGTPHTSLYGNATVTSKTLIRRISVVGSFIVCNRGVKIPLCQATYYAIEVIPDSNSKFNIVLDFIEEKYN